MRIYLAGPEVFLPDAAALGAAKKAICARHGLEGVFPLDTQDLPAADLPGWARIHAACEAHMRSCDALLANLTPFRGGGADPGTTLELGYMRALGRPLFGYTHATGDYRTRITSRRDGAAWRDEAGMEVEDFGLADNLMIEGSIAASGGVFLRPAAPLGWNDTSLFEACVVAAARRLLG
nr:nucleoside 2-deoxyribosyltransferase [uncultured Roseococcus sp.]